MKLTQPTKLVLLIAVLIVWPLGVLTYLNNPSRAHADSSRFDHVQIIGTSFLYKGSQGVLLLDRRNGNIWFMPRGQDMESTWFKDPVFLLRAPLEKLDNPPQQQ